MYKANKVIAIHKLSISKEVVKVQLDPNCNFQFNRITNGLNENSLCNKKFIECIF